MTNKAIFLDRDGTLNHDSNYVYKLDDLVVLPGVKEGLHLLKDNGYRLIVITNQSGIGRGYYSMEQFTAFNQELQKQLELKFDAICCCPHKPDESCPCRKPKSDMTIAIAENLDIDESQSYFIGDKESDIQCGKSVGCKTILIGENLEIESDYQTLSFLDAVNLILKDQK